MRNILLALGLVATGMHAVAQNQSHSYNRTVFNDATASRSLSAEAVAQTRLQVVRNFPGWHISLDNVSGTITDIYGPALNIAGNTNEARSLYAMDNFLKSLGINKAEWHKVRDEAAPKAAYVDYEQSFNGHNVAFARMSFRFTLDGRLVRVKNNSYGKPGNASAKLNAQDVLAADAILDGTSGIIVAKREVSSDWVWFPIPGNNSYELHPAWEVTIVGKEAEGAPVWLKGYVDATNGELLYRTSEINETSDLTVKGSVYTQTTSDPATLENLPYIEVKMNGNTYNADANGFVSDGANNPTAEVALRGLWSEVFFPSSTPVFTGIPVTGTGGTYTFPNTAPSSDRAINAYYHVNTVHDFMKPYLPGFNNLDVALETNIDVTGQTCNAFYDGSSINFYAAGGSCKTFAEIRDVVYHEYGHGISGRFYSWKGTSFQNGGMNEGNSDVWGMSITHDSVLGRNAYLTGGYIRRYDVNYKVYPQDIVGEVHADGEIIAGAWYDVAKNLNDWGMMTSLFTSTYYDLPNGPNGTEGKLYHDVLISALMNDDDDADFSNGTPHFAAIANAFAKHGIYLLADAVLDHKELDHQPANTPITVTATLTLVNPDFFQSLKVMYRNRAVGKWDTLTMTGNNGVYTATIPAQPFSSIIDYYFHVYDYMTLPSATFPANFFADPSLAYRSNLPYQFGVGVHVTNKTTFDDGPQTDWTIGATDDNATSGIWVQVKPTGTFSQNIPVQTGKDHTTGEGQCMVTGNGTGSSANSADVDGGKTTLISPKLNMAGYVNPIIEYYRWFSNDRGSVRRADPWQAQIKSANGALWYSVDNTIQSDNSWRRRIFAIYDYVNTNVDIYVRFVAADKAPTTSGQQTIEAAVDDFFIYDGTPLSVTDVAPAKATIYPNPANDAIRVVLPSATKGSMSLYDVTGRAIATYQLDGVNTHYVINTASVAAGHYSLLIQTDNKTIQSQQVVVSHQ